MAPSPNDTGHNDDFVHHIAIKLSRELNTINPNDLLARRVIDIATSNSLSAFTNGTWSA
jgi:pre-mRNA-splicing factor ATP-dependent RNA helicase DHX38/PRP16